MRAGSLLFNIFFTAVVLVALRRFSEDADTLANLVHLKEPPVGPEMALKCFRPVVWRMLYANDACIMSRPLRGLGLIMAVIVDFCGAFGVTVSDKKTEAMHMLIPYGPATWRVNDTARMSRFSTSGVPLQKSPACRPSLDRPTDFFGVDKLEPLPVGANTVTRRHPYSALRCEW